MGCDHIQKMTESHPLSVREGGQHDFGGVTSFLEYSGYMTQKEFIN